MYIYPYFMWIRVLSMKFNTQYIVRYVRCTYHTSTLTDLLTCLLVLPTVILHNRRTVPRDILINATGPTANRETQNG